MPLRATSLPDARPRPGATFLALSTSVNSLSESPAETDAHQRDSLPDLNISTALSTFHPLAPASRRRLAIVDLSLCSSSSFAITSSSLSSPLSTLTESSSDFVCTVLYCIPKGCEALGVLRGRGLVGEPIGEGVGERRELASRLLAPSIVLTEFVKMAGARTGEAATQKVRVRGLQGEAGRDPETHGGSAEDISGRSLVPGPQMTSPPSLARETTAGSDDVFRPASPVGRHRGVGMLLSHAGVPTYSGNV